MEGESIFVGGMVLLVFALAAAIFGVWLWSLIHCIRNRYLSDSNRLIGILLIVLLGIIGSIIYPFLPREGTPQR